MQISRGRLKVLVLASITATIGLASAWHPAIIGFTAPWHRDRVKATEESVRREAQGRFLSIALRHVGAKYLDNENPGEVTAVFLKCFKEGDEAAKYDAILKTGREFHSSGLHYYTWALHLPNPQVQDSTMRGLVVYVTGSPARIQLIYVADSID